MSMREELNDLFEERADDSCSFGFDWGTYSSQIAVQEGNKKPQVADYTGENRNGIPSLFYRGPDGREYCGDKAKGPGKTDPSNVCRSVKMKLSEREIVLNGHSYTPFEISEKLIRGILKTTAETLEQDFIEFDPATARMVCGVPVRFNAAERGQVQQMIRRASGASEVRLVSEPILAALAYDYFLKSSDDRPVLCFDCGAGTFDVCVLKKTPAGETPYTVCDGLEGIRVAGDRLDELMAELILSKLRKAPGNLELAALADRNTLDGRYFREWQAREMKEALTDNESYTMPVTSVDGRRSSNVTVTRAEYEEAIRPTVKQMTELSAKVLGAAGLGAKPDIRILLVGGSCRIPLMETMLREEFPWVRDIKLRNPQQMVALGAAIYARQAREIVTSKVPFGYAVETYVTGKKKNMLSVEIPSDAELPIHVVSYYGTLVENQTGILFSIFEVAHGESHELLELGEGRKMGGEYWLRHSFGKPVPKGTSVRLDTELNTDGVLTMTVDDIGISGSISSKTFTLANSCL